MCGVFGYLGRNKSLMEVVQGLKRMEYRGYDSWGVAFPVSNQLETFKTLESLQDTASTQFDLQVEFALGHTRWATHGAVNLTNCHPHVSACGRFALVHNGVVENYLHLKSEIKTKGEKLDTDTDTEIIVRLIEQALNSNECINSPLIDSYRIAMETAFKLLKGHNTLVLIAIDQQLLLGIRNGSPLVAGRKINDIFLASDCNAFAHHTNECLLLEEKQMIICSSNGVDLFDIATQSTIEPKWQLLELNNEVLSKQDYPHYMLKEICEQWQSIPNASNINLELIERLAVAIKNQGKLYVTGAGAALFIAEQIAWMLRNFANITVVSIPAYESQEYLPQMQAGDILLTISQSGETADTLRFVQAAKTKGVLIASVVNMSGAMLSRLSEFPFYSQSGPEVCVLSTKSGTAQLTFGYLLTQHLLGNADLANTDIRSIPYYLSRYFSPDSLQDFVDLADSIHGEHLYLLGQGQYLAAAKVGALNIKEASYVHAEAFSAGELKHGVLALVEKGTPVICFVDDDNQDYMVAVASEVKARGGYIIGICSQPIDIFDQVIVFPFSNNPASVITSIIPCQLLAYFLAIKKGNNPDRPRNLAKSVTVL